MLTAEEILEVLAEAGIDTREKFLDLIRGAIKPVQRATIQAEIDAARAEFAAQQATYNEQLAALQAKLNAV